MRAEQVRAGLGTESSAERGVAGRVRGAACSGRQRGGIDEQRGRALAHAAANRTGQAGALGDAERVRVVEVWRERVGLCAAKAERLEKGDGLALRLLRGAALGTGLTRTAGVEAKPVAAAAWLRWRGLRERCRVGWRGHTRGELIGWKDFNAGNCARSACAVR